MPTKIETHLTPEQLQEFCRRVAQTKGGTKLATIQGIADEFGVQISLMSASAFRDGPLSTYLEELRSKREMAEQVAEVAKSGLSLSDAAASAFAAKVFDKAVNIDAEEVGGKAANNLSLAIARLRQGDQRAAKLEADLRLRDEQIAKLQADARAREEKAAAAKAALEGVKSKGGLTAETLKRIEEAAGLL